jgi:hypothetical protein
MLRVMGAALMYTLDGIGTEKMNIEFHEKHLSNLGIELEKARTRRLDTLNEIRRISTVAEMTKCNKSMARLVSLTGLKRLMRD